MNKTSKPSPQQLLNKVKRLQKENQELKGWKERYLSLERTTPEAVTITDLTGRITGVSKRSLELHGTRNTDDLIGTNAFDLIAPEYREMARKNLEKTVTEENIHGIEYEMLRKDGTRFMAELSAAIIKDHKGQPQAFIATTRDVTSKKEAERILLESEERYRGLFEHVPIGLYRTSPDGKIMDANPALVEMLAYPSLQLLRKKKASEIFVSPEARQKELNYINKTGIARGYDIQMQRHDNTIIWARDTVRAFRNEEGKLLYYEGSLEDITTRKILEHAVHESEEKYRSLTENLNVGVYRNTGGTSGVFIEANPAIIKMFGYKNKKDFLAVRVSNLYNNPKDRIRFDKKIKQKGFVKDEELILVKKDGKTFIGSVSAVAVKDKDGKIVYYDGVIEDITKRKKTEDSLRESERRYRTTLNSMKEAIHVVDRDLIIQLMNDSFIRWNQKLGLETNVVGKNLFSVFPFLSEDTKNEYKQVFKTGSTLTTHEQTEISDKILLTETRKIPISENGEVIKVVTIINDITERKRIEKMQEAIYQISEATSTAGDLEGLYKAIHETVSDLMPAKDNFYIALYDESSKLLSFPYFVDENDETPEPKHLGKGLTEYVLRTGKPQLVPPEKFTKLVQSGKVESIGTPSIDWLGIPLKSKNQTFGVLTVQSYKKGLRYDEKDKEILTFISEQVSMAIERKRTEEALRESERRYGALFEGSLNVIFISDFNGDLIDANQACLDLLGYTKEEFQSLNMTAFLPDDQLQKAAQVLENSRKGIPQKHSLQYKVKKKDGSLIWIEVESTTIHRDGEPYAIQGIARDITEQKRFQEALRESEEKYRAIFESFYDVYYRTNREGEVILISPSVESQSGYKPEEVTGRPVTDFYENPDQYAKFIQTLQEKGYVNDYELRFLAKDGRIIEASTSSKLIFDREGQPLGVEGVLRDITDRKQADQQIKASLEEKEVLLKEIHHRVKNNMQIISSLLNLQCSQIQNQDVIDMFKESRDRIRAMALIHEKLYLSKDLAKIDFTQYIKSLALHLYQVYQVDSGTIFLESQVDDVYLDINQAIPCGLIINELLSNSLKHAFPEKSQGKIHLKLVSPEAGHYVLSVSDNGIGIPRNTRIEQPNSLGLQLVNDLVAQLGGKIHLDVKDGTSFRIEF